MVTQIQLQQALDALKESITGSISDLKKSTDENQVEVVNKIESLAQRINSVEQMIDVCVQDVSELKEQVQENKVRYETKIENLNMRIVLLEDKLIALESLPGKVVKQRELTEERTNR